MASSRSPLHQDPYPLHISMLSEVLSYGEKSNSSERGSPARQASAEEASVSFDVQEALLPKPEVNFEHPIPRWKRTYMISLFTLTAALLYADQSVLAPNLSAAAKDFGFTDAQKDQMLGGYLMAAFFLVGAPAALVVGWLTAKVNRRWLLFWVVLVGQAPCLLTYWAATYWQFFLLRTMTGISVGGSFPLVYSLLGDLVPIESRSAVSAAVAIANGVGIAAGQGLASIVGPATNWRLPFVLVAIPAVLLALVMVLTTSDPPRGAFEVALQAGMGEGLSYEEVISWAKTRVLLKQTSNWLIIVQGLPGCLPWGMILTYFNDYLSYDKGLSIQMATLVVLLFGLGGGVGTAAGGALGQWLYNKRKEYMPLLMGVSVLLGSIPVYFIVNADIAVVGVGFVAAMSTIAGIVVSIPVPNLRAVILNVNEPELRGIAVALQSMTDDVGKGLGPFIVAFFISHMGRTQAFNLAVAGWIPCSLMMLGLCCSMRTDELAMQRRLQECMERRQSRAGAASRGMSSSGCLRFEPDDGLDEQQLPVSVGLKARYSTKQEVLMVPMRTVRLSSAADGLVPAGDAASCESGYARGDSSGRIGASVGDGSDFDGCLGPSSSRSSGEGSRGAATARMLDRVLGAVGSWSLGTPGSGRSSPIKGHQQANQQSALL